MKRDKNEGKSTGGREPQSAEAWRVGEIAPEVKAQLDELIIEGATLEGATSAINEGSKFSVALSGVEHYVRSNIDLQRRRIQYIAHTTSAITEHVPGDADAVEKQLINALIMAGLLKINEKDASPFLNSMMLRRAEVTNLRLRNRLMRWKEKENRMLEKRLEAQTQLMRARTEFVEGQTAKLLEFVRKLEKKRSITPETLQKIQEIYGLLAQNVASASPNMGTLEEQNPGDPNLPRDPGVETQTYYTKPVDDYEAGKVSHRKNLNEINAGVAPGQTEPGGQPRLLTEGEDEE